MCVREYGVGVGEDRDENRDRKVETHRGIYIERDNDIVKG